MIEEGRDGQDTPPVAEDDGGTAQEAPEEVVRAAGQPEVPDGHERTGGERQSPVDPAVPQRADLQIDSGSDPREGEPAVEERQVVTEIVKVHLGGPTAYTDYPAVPSRFSRDFNIHVLPPGVPPSILHSSVVPDSGDVVSDTIRDLKTWEVPETLFMCSAFAAAPPGTMFVDIGCHVGWYSLLAMSYDLDVVALDGDHRMLQALHRSVQANAYRSRLDLRLEMIDASWHGLTIPADNVIVKLDVEGNEIHALGGLWDLFMTERVSHLLMEVSPCFEDYYPVLLTRLFDLGYIGFVMPVKQAVPPTFDDAEQFLRNHCRRLDQLSRQSMTEWVQAQHQFDMILFRHDAAFG